VDHEAVLDWVRRYEAAWRKNDLDAAVELFSEDVAYLRSPYAEPAMGRAGVREIWPDDQPVRSVRARIVAVEGLNAVVRLDVEYGATATTQEYRDLWLLRFARDERRVSRFEEWAYWPEKPYSATD